jgi:hypothetical protein
MKFSRKCRSWLMSHYTIELLWWKYRPQVESCITKRVTIRWDTEHHRRELLQVNTLAEMLTKSKGQRLEENTWCSDGTEHAYIHFTTYLDGLQEKKSNCSMYKIKCKVKSGSERFTLLILSFAFVSCACCVFLCILMCYLSGFFYTYTSFTCPLFPILLLLFSFFTDLFLLPNYL